MHCFALSVPKIVAWHRLTPQDLLFLCTDLLQELSGHVLALDGYVRLLERTLCWQWVSISTNRGNLGVSFQCFFTRRWHPSTESRWKVGTCVCIRIGLLIRMGLLDTSRAMRATISGEFYVHHLPNHAIPWWIMELSKEFTYNR